MNKILEISKRLNSSSNNRGGGQSCIPDTATLTSTKVRQLMVDISSVIHYWEERQHLKGALVSVHYEKIIAKSRRLSYLLKDAQIPPNKSVCGVKFARNSAGHLHHVITHFVSLRALHTAVEQLNIMADFLDTHFGGCIDGKTQRELGRFLPTAPPLPKTVLSGIVNDCFYVNHFNVEEYDGDADHSSIVTIYKTAVATDDFLRDIGILPHEVQKMGDTTFLLKAEQLQLMKLRAPYMISMQVNDIADFTCDDIPPYLCETQSIPDPGDEPFVGVIDTPFDTGVYFNRWVEYKSMLSPDIPLDGADYVHGTAVSSIIVDGCANNEELQDGCGRFRVKHFGVCKSGRFSSFSVIKSIREIISQNSQIKVWNLSLGSPLEINPNYISPEAAELDRIQSEYDVIFVVAGTNKPMGAPDDMKVGAPADSLNSLVVNSVTRAHMPASYSRSGPVLSFFKKPDVSYYGGDKEADRISVCTPTGESRVAGTSYAAPWIARKLAYLICKLGMTREAAKALLIHASTGWRAPVHSLFTVGFGVVPRLIGDILHTSDDEIRFIIRGKAEEYETYAYDIPVPTTDSKYTFIARATLCYFPECSRDQGVDYTNTEMDLYFGRVQAEPGGKICIKSINKNKQTDTFVYEEEARALYRKWDNVKHISEFLGTRFICRKSFGINPMWGLNIKTKERLSNKRKSKMSFAVVVTLKEMFGKNRHADFAKLCMYNGWLVNELDVQTRVDVHAIGEQQLEFDLQ